MTTTPDPEMTQGLDKRFKYAILDNTRSRYDYGRYMVLDKPAFGMLKEQAGQTGLPFPMTTGYRLWLPKLGPLSFLDRRLWSGLYCFDTQMGEVREHQNEPKHRFLSFNRSASQWQFHEQLLPTTSEAHPCHAYPWAVHVSLTYVTFRSSKTADTMSPRVLLDAAVRGHTLLKAGEDGEKLAYCNGKAVKDYKTSEHYGLKDPRLYDGSRFLQLQTGLVVPLARWASVRKDSQPRFLSYRGGTWQSRVVRYPNAGSREAGASASETKSPHAHAHAQGQSNAIREASQRPSAMRISLGSNANNQQPTTRKTVFWKDLF